MTASSEVGLIEQTKTFGRIVAVDAISAELRRQLLLPPRTVGLRQDDEVAHDRRHEVPTAGDITVGGARMTDLPPARRVPR